MEKNNKNANEAVASFNIFDVFILLFALALVVGIVLRIGNFSLSDGNDNLSDYRITFKVSDIAYSSVDHFRISDTVTVSGSGLVLGRLEGIDSVEPASAYVKTVEGEIISAEYPKDTRVNAWGSIISKGTVENSRFMLGGKTEITPGDSFAVRTERMDVVLTVVEIVKK